MCFKHHSEALAELCTIITSDPVMKIMSLGNLSERFTSGSSPNLMGRSSFCENVQRLSSRTIQKHFTLLLQNMNNGGIWELRNFDPLDVFFLNAAMLSSESNRKTGKGGRSKYPR